MRLVDPVLGQLGGGFDIDLASVTTSSPVMAGLLEATARTDGTIDGMIDITFPISAVASLSVMQGAGTQGAGTGAVRAYCESVANGTRQLLQEVVYVYAAKPLSLGDVSDAKATLDVGVGLLLVAHFLDDAQLTTDATDHVLARHDTLRAFAVASALSRVLPELDVRDNVSIMIDKDPGMLSAATRRHSSSGFHPQCPFVRSHGQCGELAELMVSVQAARAAPSISCMDYSLAGIEHRMNILLDGQSARLNRLLPRVDFRDSITACGYHHRPTFIETAWTIRKPAS